MIHTAPRFRWLALPLVLALGLMVALLSASAAGRPSPTQVFRPEPALSVLTQDVHRDLEAAWAQHRPVTARQAVLALMQRAQATLGLQTRLAYIRLAGDEQPRVVMTWGDTCYDPVLNTLLRPHEVATVVRTLGYVAAFQEHLPSASKATRSLP